MSEETTANPTPSFRVTVAGTNYGFVPLESDASVEGGVERLVVESHVDMISVAEVTFSGMTEWPFKIGDEVKVLVSGADEDDFAGIIVSLRYEMVSQRESCTVVAMDALCKYASSRNTRVYEEMKDSDVISDILGGDAGQVDKTDEKHLYIHQRNESDLDFLKRLAARNGLLLAANREGKVDLMAPNFGSAVELERRHVFQLSYTMSGSQVPPSVTVYGWDYVTKEMVQGSASSVDAIGGGSPGLGVAGTIWQGDCYVSDFLVSSQDGAQGAADAELARMARSFLRGRATIEGDGTLRAGAMVKFTGYRDGYNPEVYVVACRHVMEGRGYRTELNFCANAFPS
jgi:phage protein D